MLAEAGGPSIAITWVMGTGFSHFPPVVHQHGAFGKSAAKTDCSGRCPDGCTGTIAGGACRETITPVHPKTLRPMGREAIGAGMDKWGGKWEVGAWEVHSKGSLVSAISRREIPGEQHP